MRVVYKQDSQTAKGISSERDYTQTLGQTQEKNWTTAAGNSLGRSTPADVLGVQHPLRVGGPQRGDRLRGDRFGAHAGAADRSDRGVGSESASAEAARAVLGIRSRSEFGL